MLMKANINMIDIICPKCGNKVVIDDNNEEVETYTHVYCNKCDNCIDLYGTNFIQF